MRSVLVGFLTIVLSGCAPAVYQLPYEKTDSYSFRLSDDRDEAQKTRVLGSLSVTACDYAIKRYADDETSPNRVEYLRYALAKAGLSNVTNKSISLKTFTIYDNAQGALRTNAINAGSISGAVTAGTNSTVVIKHANSALGCAPDLHHGGFAASENPSFQPAAIAEITILLDGKEYSARAVEPANNDGPTVIKRVIVKVTDNLISQLR